MSKYDILPTKCINCGGKVFNKITSIEDVRYQCIKCGTGVSYTFRPQALQGIIEGRLGMSEYMIIIVSEE